MDSTALPDGVSAEIDHLVELKAISNETAGASRSIAIEKLIADELGRATQVPERRNDEQFIEEVDAIFRDLLSH